MSEESHNNSLQRILEERVTFNSVSVFKCTTYNANLNLVSSATCQHKVSKKKMIEVYFFGSQTRLLRGEQSVPHLIALLFKVKVKEGIKRMEPSLGWAAT